MEILQARVKEFSNLVQESEKKVADTEADLQSMVRKKERKKERKTYFKKPIS